MVWIVFIIIAWAFLAARDHDERLVRDNMELERKYKATQPERDNKVKQALKKEREGTISEVEQRGLNALRQHKPDYIKRLSS